MKEIDFINAKMNKQDVQVPHFLYKYRSFDEFTYDMLDKRYVYLCPAEKLDDPSECKVDFSVQDFYDLKTNQLTIKGIEMLLGFIKPYTSEENVQLIRNIVARRLTPQGTVCRHFLLDAWNEIQELVPDIDTAPFINWLGSIPEKLNEPEIRHNFEKLVSLAYYARRDMGICSLSELNDSAEMWCDYADDSKGYCIEYDMCNYENEALIFPVVYQDNRETNITINILGSFIGLMIYGMSNGQMKVDKAQFIRLFLTKNLKWSHQKEWRLLGDANEKLNSPTISAICLGKNALEKDKKQIAKYCKAHDIILKT
ncbi:MAG: DUF2971 domain-containing protein [Clostridia bacterium]|nr:DUF2971 domain-containing protein [Clostridia bacterium]